MTAASGSWSLSKRETLQVLKKLVHETQWQQINESIMEGGDVVVETGDDMLALIRQVMENCAGALDIFGPLELLAYDVGNYRNPSLSEGFNYVDCKLRNYMPKKEVFPFISGTVMRRTVQILDQSLYRILVDTFAMRVQNQLAGTFEIVSTEAGYNMEYVVKDWLKNFKKDPIEELEKANWNQKTCEEMFQEIMKFWKLSDDSRNWIRLRSYINSVGTITYEVFSQFRSLYHLLDTMLTENQYIFNTFEAAEKAPSGEKFESFIRMFHDGKKTFLFVKDVERELEKALAAMYDGELEVKGILNFETASDLAKGRFSIISFSKFLEIIDQFKLDRDAITLVNVEVKRTRHLAVPIISPYCTECKPIIDAFYEILSILTIELQAWQRVPNQRIKLMLDLIFIAFVTLLDPQTPEHLISTQAIEIIGSKLRNDVGRLLEEPVRNVEAFKGRKPLTWYLLYEEVIENWKLERIFPDIRKAVNSVFTKHVDFEKPKLVSRLELTMMVQECISLCLLMGAPGLLHCLGLCHLARDASCEACILPCHREVLSEPPPQVIVQAEPDFQFHYALIQGLIHPGLREMKRKDSQTLVTNSTVRSFLLENLFQDTALSTEGVVETINLTFKKELITKWKKPEDTAKFYVTRDEMVDFVIDIENKFIRSSPKELKKLLRASEEASDEDYPRAWHRIVRTLGLGLEAWMKYANRCVKSLTSFSEFAPNRIFYLKYIRLFPEDSDEKEPYVNAGEFLEVVKILLNQRSDPVSKEEWDLFEKLARDWLSTSGWIDVTVEEIQKTLMLFSVDTKRIRFVPEIWCFFREVMTTDWSEFEECEDSEGGDSEDSEDGSEKQVQSRKDNPLMAAYTELLAEKQQLLEISAKLAEDLKGQKAVGKEQAEQLMQKQKQNDELNKMVELLRRDMEKMSKDCNRAVEYAEAMKKALESRPKTYQDDPIVVNLMIEKDQMIRKLALENLDKDHEIGELKTKWGTAKREKKTLERQLADAISKNRDFESMELQNLNLLKNIKELEKKMAIQASDASSQLRLEQIKHERWNSNFLKQIEELENKLSTLVALSSASSSDPPASECGICFTDMGKRAKTTKCGTCKTIWHAACITKWTATNPTCPMCRSAFPDKGNK